MKSGRGATKKANAGNQTEKKKENESAAFAQTLVAQSSVCLFCTINHELTKSDAFLDFTSSQRLADLVTYPGKMCFKRLKLKSAAGHPRTFRKGTSKYEVGDCHESHHFLLHVDAAAFSANYVKAINCI